MTAHIESASPVGAGGHRPSSPPGTELIGGPLAHPDHRVIPPQIARPRRLVPADSPRLVTLRSDLEHGRAGAVDDFWQEVEQQGTPMVEPAPGLPGYSVLTFLWRDPGDTEDVVVIANKATDASVVDDACMQQLPGSDVWYLSLLQRSDLRSSYQLGVVRTADSALDTPLIRAVVERAAEISPSVPAASVARWARGGQFARTDPLNRREYPPKHSFLELPAAPEHPWMRGPSGSPQGTLTHRRIAAGPIAAVPSTADDTERSVWIYTPAGYRDTGERYPLVVMFDGEDWVDEGVTDIFDNAIADGAVPPFVAVLIDSIAVPRRLHELSCNDEFLDQVMFSILPTVRAEFHVADTPDRTVAAGQSLGGLTSAYVTYRYPEIVGNALSQSGSFWYLSGSEFDVHAQWLTRRFAEIPRLDVRFHLEVGLQEWALLAPTRNLRNVLQAKGYQVNHLEFNGGHDPACWRGSIIVGLQELLSS